MNDKKVPKRPKLFVTFHGGEDQTAFKKWGIGHLNDW